MKLTRMLKFKKAKINKKYYGSGWDRGCTYNVVSDGAIVSKLNELCDKYNAEIVRIRLTADDFDDKDCIIKIKAHRKDFKNIVNDFTLHFIRYIEHLRY